MFLVFFPHQAGHRRCRRILAGGPPGRRARGAARRRDGRAGVCAARACSTPNATLHGGGVSELLRSAICRCSTIRARRRPRTIISGNCALLPGHEDESTTGCIGADVHLLERRTRRATWTRTAPTLPTSTRTTTSSSSTIRRLAALPQFTARGARQRVGGRTSTRRIPIPRYGTSRAVIRRVRRLRSSRWPSSCPPTCRRRPSDIDPAGYSTCGTPKNLALLDLTARQVLEWISACAPSSPS